MMMVVVMLLKVFARAKRSRPQWNLHAWQTHQRWC